MATASRDLTHGQLRVGSIQLAGMAAVLRQGGSAWVRARAQRSASTHQAMRAIEAPPRRLAAVQLILDCIQANADTGVAGERRERARARAQAGVDRYHSA